jgi:hypothetical protein
MLMSGDPAAAATPLMSSIKEKSYDSIYAQARCTADSGHHRGIVSDFLIMYIAPETSRE